MNTVVTPEKNRSFARAQNLALRPTFEARPRARERRQAGAGLFRYASADAWLVAIALLHGALAASGIALFRTAPSPAQLILAATFTALGMWWSSNTVSHNHLHNPLFRSRPLNRLLTLYLSVLLGIPQTLWRARHLAHHAGYAKPKRSRARAGASLRPRAALLTSARSELALCGLTWALSLWLAPQLFLFGCLPGYLLGLGLCWLQGHYEHLGEGGSAGVSHYGALYNRIWLNDGYHAEHHRYPREHWTLLPTRRIASAPESRLPPVTRWLGFGAVALNRGQAGALCGLERVALRSPFLQRWLLAVHERAFRALWPRLGAISSVAIVGGGLFPRTALVLRRIAPACKLVIIDADASNLARAHAFLAARGALADVELRHAFFAPSAQSSFDLIVIPLAFLGERERLYEPQRGTPHLVHDWIWHARGEAGTTISHLLAKRLNLVRA